MTNDEREARLTAYALGDPSMDAAARTDFALQLEADPAMRAELEQTKAVAALLAGELAAEPQPLPSDRLPLAVSAPPKPSRGAKLYRWATALGLFAAVGVAGWQFWPRTVADQQRLASRVPAEQRSAEDFERGAAASPQSRDGAQALGFRQLANETTPGVETTKLDAQLATATPPADAKRSVLALEQEENVGIPNEYLKRPASPAPASAPASVEAKPAGEAAASAKEGFVQRMNGVVADNSPISRNHNSGGIVGIPPATAAPVQTRGMMGGSGPQGGVAIAGQPGAKFNMPAGGGLGGGGGGLGALPAQDFAMALDVVDGEGFRGFNPEEAREAARFRLIKQQEAANTNKFQPLDENPFVAVQGEAALSTFGVDVDTASYSMVRKFLTQNQLPPPGAVRLEEIVNYFPYRDAPPDGAEPFAVRVEMAECPWQPKHRLVRLGLKAKPVANDKRPQSNLVFLIDVSGSMNQPNKLPLVKASLKLLVDELGENDRVAMVVYAGSSGLVLDSTSAAKKVDILYALERLEAGGSTNGAGGIRQAYEVAVKSFIKGGTNRVILCTDGDWNVGTTSTDELVKLVEEKRQTGVFLSVLGFGMGNLRDEMMVNLAGKGNGNYAYIDSIKEAKKALVEQMGGTLVTVAKDVKIQVEFNPAVVGAYRLLGYEKRKLAAADFHNDKKDAGEMGAGHVVTALYELVPAGGAIPGSPKVDPLRYQEGTKPKDATAKEAFVVKLRHKAPDSDVSTLREIPVADNSQPYAKASEDFRFAAAAASFAQVVRNSSNKGNATYAAIVELAEAAKSHDPGGYRAEFVGLVRKAKELAQQP